MCGICGIVVRDAKIEAQAVGQRVSTMVRSLEHRGPEQSRLESSPGVTFGATRLAIRGLVGLQPYHDPESGVIAVCNGEIDNHRELRAWLAERGRTVEHDTDVAVVPALYLELGEAFVDRISGAFAIAVWDPRSGELHLVRDRAGERPLFYAIDDDAVIFATEVGALARNLSLDLEPDEEALAKYVQSGSFPAPASPYCEIRKVGPAEIVSISPDEVRRRRYWRWPVVNGPKHEPDIERFDRAFRAAVRRQSDVDTDFGVLLSGGLDSSLVAAVLRSVRPEGRLAAYTLRFGEASYDESTFAETIAEKLGVDLTPVDVRAEDFPAMITELVQTAGEPLADPAWVPVSLLARRVRQDVKMAFVGEGADELFGGYPTYLGVGAARAFARWPRPVRTALRALVERLPHSDRKVTISFLLKRFLAGSELSGLARHQLWTSSVPADLIERLGLPARSVARDDDEGAELLDSVQRYDLEGSLAEGLLTKADRASMNWALELRSPFLDREVMELAATLPVRQRVRRLKTKVFLKRYAERYLPRSVVHRTKRGLSVPLSAWLRGPLEGWARERLETPLFGSVGIRPEVALQLFDEHRVRAADHARALWTLIVLAVWLEWNAGRDSS